MIIWHNKKRGLRLLRVFLKNSNKVFRLLDARHLGELPMTGIGSAGGDDSHWVM